jgi:modulator of FtsH protease
MSLQDWSNFGLVVGAASGAVVGLLFVAVSLIRDRIARNRSLRASASQTLTLFVMPLIASILLVTPGQARWVLGTELIALAAIGGLALVSTGRSRQAPSGDEDSRLADLTDRSSPTLVTPLFSLIAGVTLLAGHGGGLYWLVPMVVFAFVGGVMNAWWFLIGTPS